MPHPLVITMCDRHDPREVLGFADGSLAGFTTDRRRAKPFPTRRAGWPLTGFGDGSRAKQSASRHD